MPHDDLPAPAATAPGATDERASGGGVVLQDGGARWVMWGEVDAAVQARVEDDVVASLRPDRRTTVDLGDVTFMDSGGLRLLYHAATQGPEAPVLERVPRRIRDLLEIGGVADLFEIRDATPDPR